MEQQNRSTRPFESKVNAGSKVFINRIYTVYITVYNQDKSIQE